MMITNPTVRDKIMAHLLDRFSQQVAGAAGALITWEHVVDTPLTKEQQEARYALGIYDTSEKVMVQVGRDDRNMNVVLEFHLKLYEDDPQGTYIRQALGEVQRVMGSDIYCGGLTLNLVEKGSELEVLSEKDRHVAGVAVFEVKYRTLTNNPFVQS